MPLFISLIFHLSRPLSIRVRQVFAFGQTGTGKTYTMEGDISSAVHMGVIPRACRLVFDTLAEERFTASKVTVSYLEIYNEQLSDLLSADDAVGGGGGSAKPLRICTASKQHGSRVTCMGLSSRPVSSPAEILAILDEARERRRVAETNMNKQSSRSHVIFVSCFVVFLLFFAGFVVVVVLVFLAGPFSVCQQKLITHTHTHTHTHHLHHATIPCATIFSDHHSALL